jgi:hypothetical protein
MPEKPLHDVRFANVLARGRSAGAIEFARNWEMSNVKLVTDSGAPLKLSHCENVEAPAVEAVAAPARAAH